MISDYRGLVEFFSDYLGTEGFDTQGQLETYCDLMMAKLELMLADELEEDETLLDYPIDEEVFEVFGEDTTMFWVRAAEAVMDYKPRVFTWSGCCHLEMDEANIDSEEWEVLCLLAGEDPEDNELIFCRLLEPLDDVPVGTLVLTGMQVEGHLFTVFVEVGE